MGVRHHSDRDGVGTAILCKGFSAHDGCFVPDPVPDPDPVLGSGAPDFTHLAIDTISASVSFEPGGIDGAPAACFTARTRRLLSGSPITSAGPETPPFRIPPFVSMESPPFGVSPE